MNFDSIIKIVFLFGIVYLFFNSVLEKFANNFDSKKPAKFALKAPDDKLYYLISFFDLNDIYKKIVLNNYINQLALDKTNKTNVLESSFLSDENQINLTIDKALTITSTDFNKIPVFIISADDLTKYTKSVLTFSILTEQGYTIFTPVDDQYLFYNPKRNILYYSLKDIDNGGIHIKTSGTIPATGEITEVQTDKPITNLTPVQMESGADIFKYYTVNTTTPGSYKWILSN